MWHGVTEDSISAGVQHVCGGVQHMIKWQCGWSGLSPRSRAVFLVLSVATCLSSG